MPRHRNRLIALATLLISCLRTASGAAEPVDYARDVQGILHRCHACHGALRQQGSLRLDTAALMQQGGDSGPAIVPGDAEQSLLIQAVSGSGGVSAMPPEGEAAPLTQEEIGKLRDWINAGAPAPENEPTPQDPRQHWSFLPPTRPDLPEVADSQWIRTPVDAFVRARQEALGLPHSPPAPKHVLLRRVYLDLIGLPPTPEQLQEFLADDRPDAYQRVVARLLDSPQYGERWGRHWMDVWRYGDWAGYGAEIRESQYHLWRRRDWIVESLNDDRPYDQMVLEMLAGDELAPGDPDVLRATGYLGRNWYKFNRNVWLDNTIEHSGKAFLGLTFNCARCHDHKYDPISQVEYYKLRAIFEAYDVRYDRVPGQPDVTKDGIARVFDKRPADPTYLFVRGNEAQPDKDHLLSPQLPEMFRADFAPAEVPLPVESFYPALTDFVVKESRAALEQKLADSAQQLAQAQTALEQSQSALAEFTDNPQVPSPQPQVIVEDPFDQPQPELWTASGGDWQYREGRLVQQEVSMAPPAMILQREMPQDFHLTLSFRTTGGNVYKSVGFSFDYLDPGNYQSVYLSALEGGQKLQAYHAKNGQVAYPQAGAVAQSVALGEPQTLEVAVRGDLMNIWVNGQFRLAYSLPVPRRTGALTLWAFDAQAEFDHVKVVSLPADMPLAGAGSSQPPLPIDPEQRRTSLEQSIAAAQVQVEQARQLEQAARADLVSFDARLAAERAKYGLTPDADLAALAQSASLAERTAAAAHADLAVGKARQELAEATRVAPEGADEAAKMKVTAAENKLAEAVKAAEQAHSQAAQPGESYAPLGEIHPQNSTGRRLALARWITDRSNPLTARVAINQIWMRHFGEPLVPSVFDFGLNGSPPSHPELLDWLAVELMDSGWRMKPIHRMIVLSATYQQQSSPLFDALQPDPRSLDPDNRWLWRMNARRMEAETVRDSLLSLSGTLDLTMGGPEIDEGKGQEVPRRSIYFRHAKEKEMVFTKLFDGPGVSECYQRNESIVPQQSLALANSPLAKAQARRLAERLSELAGPPPTAANQQRFVTEAFWHVLAREATADEQQACLEFLATQSQLLTAPDRLTASSVGQPASVAAADSPQQRARENLVHVLLNHHDFITIH